MKRKSGFILQTIGDDVFAVAVTPEAAGIGSMIKLNPTAATIFSLLEGDCTEADCVAALMERYDVTEEIATRDARAFLARLAEAGLLA